MSIISKVDLIIKRLRAERRGSVAIIFGMTMIPVAFTVGTALDYGNAMRAKTALQAATDAAALAGSSILAASNVSRTTLAQNTFQANLPRFMKTSATAVVTPTLENVGVDSTFEVPTTFARLMNIMSLPAKVDHVEMQYIAAESDPSSVHGQGANVLVEITVDVEGEIFAGRSRGRDILPCCVAAYIDAVGNADAVRRAVGMSAARTQAA